MTYPVHTIVLFGGNIIVHAFTLNRKLRIEMQHQMTSFTR